MIEPGNTGVDVIKHSPSGADSHEIEFQCLLALIHKAPNSKSATREPLLAKWEDVRQISYKRRTRVRYLLLSIFKVPLPPPLANGIALNL